MGRDFMRRNTATWPRFMEGYALSFSLRELD